MLGLGNTSSASKPYLLDNFTTATGAFSLRKLSKDYVGPAIRVRRSSDNTESDIYFTQSGLLDTISLSGFVGNNSGYITKWYDQSIIKHNLLYYSEEFDNTTYWNSVAGYGSLVITTPNTTTAPDGTLTADKIEYNSGPVSRKVQTYTIESGIFYVFSIYLKKISTDLVYVFLDVNGSSSDQDTKWGSSSRYPYITYNFATDTLSSATVTTVYGRVRLPNDWVRIYIGQKCLVSSGVAPYCGLQIGPSESFYIWGAQLTQSADLEQYIKTRNTNIGYLDAIQTTAANQPRIVNGGITETIDNIPVINVLSGTSLYSTISLTGSTEFSQISVLKVVNASTWLNVVGWVGGTGNYKYYEDGRVYTPSSGNEYTSIPFNTKIIEFFTQKFGGAYDDNTIENKFFSVNGLNKNIVINRDLWNTTVINYPVASLDNDNILLHERIFFSASQYTNKIEIERNVNDFYKIKWNGTGNSILDKYSGTLGAYALRNLSSNYKGPLIRVRRSGDNAETDIYGTYTGDLDEVALTSFTSTNSAYVTKWYNQSIGSNLIQYSEELNNTYWSGNNLTITQNAAIAPDGTMTADKIIPNSGTNISTPAVYVLTDTATDVRTFSVHFKAAEYTKAFISISGSTGLPNIVPIIVFDLTLGTVVYSQGNAAYGNIMPVGNGWYRAWMTYPNSTSNYVPNIGVCSDTYSVGPLFISATTNGTSGIYAWGAQLTSTSYVEPYFKTTGSTKQHYHAVQTTAASQPRIVNAGVIERNGTKPTLVFDGSDDALNTGAPAGGASEYTEILYVNGSGGLHQRYIAGNSAYGVKFSNTSIIFDDWLSATGNKETTINLPNVANKLLTISGTGLNDTSGGNVSVYQNSSYQGGFVNASTRLSAFGWIGQGDAAIGSLSPYYFSGKMSLAMFYPMGVGSGRTDIETLLNSYYNIY